MVNPRPHRIRHINKVDTVRHLLSLHMISPHMDHLNKADSSTDKSLHTANPSKANMANQHILLLNKSSEIGQEALQLRDNIPSKVLTTRAHTQPIRTSRNTRRLQRRRRTTVNKEAGNSCILFFNASWLQWRLGSVDME
jgi:hypothetical protein